MLARGLSVGPGNGMFGNARLLDTPLKVQSEGEAEVFIRLRGEDRKRGLEIPKQRLLCPWRITAFG